jgi:hypothetical protein
MGDLEAAHRGPALLGIVGRGRAEALLDLRELRTYLPNALVQDAALGVGHRAGRIIGLDLLVDERIEEKLLSHVLEKALLPPAFEHPIDELDVAQVAAAGQHGSGVRPRGSWRRTAARPRAHKIGCAVGGVEMPTKSTSCRRSKKKSGQVSVRSPSWRDAGISVAYEGYVKEV